ncbi:MAG: 50S ribosomal protein L5, partial [Patescibacteria group bacterium]|nr:50S ribosomal protein L5 [Patescibacteria group bacterium]
LTFRKLITIVLPKVRDFRGLPTQSFDNQGNYTLGLREHGIFPEVDYSTSTFEKSKGLEISIVSNAQDKERGKRLLELMGMPFKKK